ncbi:MAG: hypothetical protein ACFBZ8_08250 [Opitutales bacterium]
MNFRLLAFATLALPFTFSALHAAPSGSYADWRIQVWGPVDGLIDAISGPEADFDGDGLKNSLEYTLGTDPTTPNASAFDSMDMGPGASLSFRYSQFDNAVGAAVWPEYATDLSLPNPWTTADGINLDVTGDGVAAVASSFASSSFVGTLSGPATAYIRLNSSVDADADGDTASQNWVWVEAENGGTNSSWPGLSSDNMRWTQAPQIFSRPFNIPADSTYTVWARKRWEQRDWQWRVDGGPWNFVASAPLEDVQIYHVTNSGDRIGWQIAGEITLSAGNHTLEVQNLAPNNGFHGWDCFLFIDYPFTPSGEAQPDELAATPEPGKFLFEPEVDPYTYSPIDLRFLNEPFAGSKGYISTQGEDFIHNDTGEKVRFWAANASSGIAALNRESVDEMARHLSKRGVNLIRYHSPFWIQSGSNFGNINESKLDDIFYFVASLKQEGIYTGFSIYFPLWADYWDSVGYFPPSGTDNTFAALYHDPALQAIYRNFWTQLLTRVNPYTGLALKDDPAVAYLEMVNEDSYLFWTFTPRGNIPQEQIDILEPLFGTWATDKYGSLQTAFNTWNQSEPGDDVATGQAGFDNSVIFRATSDGPQSQRDADAVTFLAQLQKQFYDDTYDFLKNTIGFKAPITGSNWKTADPQYLDPLDKWSNTGADFMDRHGYYGSSTEGPSNSFDVLDTQVYYDRAAVKFQNNEGVDEGSFGHVVYDLRHNNLPSIISETDYPEPNRYRADQPFVHAAYASLQGSDGIVFFSITGPRFLNAIEKWPLQSPMTLGQFPAFAYIYRQGLVQEAPSVAEFDLLLDDLFALEGAPVSAPQNFDDLRDADIPPGGQIPGASTIDPLAYLVGKVGLNYVESDPTSDVISLEPFIDRTDKVVDSFTGELEWDWGNGLITMDTPQAQGVTGFLLDTIIAKAGPLDLTDVSIVSGMHYGTIILVSLDGKPITESGKMLLQIGTEERPTGWDETGTSPGPKTINSIGNGPFQLTEVDGTVTINRPDAASLTVTPLDFNGYRTDTPPTTGANPITLQSDVIYYLIED